MNGLTQQQLHKIFYYRDGKLYWKISPSNRIQAHNIAGYLHRSSGYYVVTIQNKQYRLHRMIFLYHYGYLPKFIDHIDNDKTNNDIDNLRECTHSQNMRNSSSSKNSSSIFKGVYWKQSIKKWSANIYYDNTQHYLGYFINEIDAAKAYDKAAKAYGSTFAKLNLPIVTSSIVCD